MYHTVAALTAFVGKQDPSIIVSREGKWCVLRRDTDGDWDYMYVARSLSDVQQMKSLRRVY